MGTVRFRTMYLDTHSHWKWPTQLWLQNFDDECYACTLCFFLVQHTWTQEEMFSLKFHWYISIQWSLGNMDHWVVQSILGWLQFSPPTLMIWSWSWLPNEGGGASAKLYSKTDGMGKAQRGSLSLLISSTVGMWPCKCCSSVPLLFHHYTEAIKYSVGR